MCPSKKRRGTVMIAVKKYWAIQSDNDIIENFESQLINVWKVVTFVTQITAFWVVLKFSIHCILKWNFVVVALDYK